MKKVVLTVLVLSLALAGLPALAQSYTRIPYTLDLSGGPATITWEGGGPEAYAESEFGRMVTTVQVAWQTGVFYETDYNYDGETETDILWYSVDGDTVPDLKLTEYPGGMRFEALPEAGCGPSIVLELPDPPSPIRAVDVAFYSPLTIIFSREPDMPATFADATGSYAIEDGEAEYLKPAKKNQASAKIPNEITVNGRTVPVTFIAPSAFKNQKKLTKVTIGANVREIGKGAFQNCVKLKTVSGGAGVKIIGDSAFQGCKALKSFTIGKNVIRIGKKAFYKCAALKKITIKTELLLKANSIGSSAFKGIYNTATIKVPKSVKKEYTKILLKKGCKKTMKIK